MMRYVFALLALAVLEVNAQAPKSFFGIELGAAYEFEVLAREGSGKIVSVETNTPIRRVVGVRNFWYQGFTFHFEPLEVDSQFPYLEYESDPQKNYINSSYSFTALFSPKHGIPQYPFNKKIKMEVVSIQWEGDLAAASRREYEQTIKNCDALQARYGRPNEVFNYQLTYVCEFFGENDSLLTARSATPMQVNLRIAEDQLNEKLKAVSAIRDAWTPQS
jgi:hypothetical protein